MEREALTLDNLALAMAAKNSNGFVIAQVERIAAPGALNPRQVLIPGVLVDCVVVAQAANHLQTYGTPYSPAFSGERGAARHAAPMPLDERKVIARRCAFELPMGGVVNLGIGMPEGVAAVANEEKVLELRHADRGARRDRRPAAERARLRRGGQHRRGHPPEPAVRLLRRRRARHGVPRHGAGRPRRQRQREPLRPAARRRRRLHQHQPERAQARVRRHVHRRRARGADRGRQARDRPRREARGSSSRRSSRSRSTAPTRRRPGSRCSTSPSAACSGAAARAWSSSRSRPGIDIERDILAQMGFEPIVREPKADGPADLPRRADAARGDAAGPEARRARELRRRAQHPVPQPRGPHVRTRDDVDRVRRVLDENYRPLVGQVALVVNYDNFLIDDRLAERYYGDDPLHGEHYITLSRATRRARSCGSSSARRSRGAAWRRTFSRRGPRRRRTPRRTARSEAEFPEEDP